MAAFFLSDLRLTRPRMVLAPDVGIVTKANSITRVASQTKFAMAIVPASPEPLWKPATRAWKRVCAQCEQQRAKE
jgi:hypothetical protein